MRFLVGGLTNTHEVQLFDTGAFARVWFLASASPASAARQLRKSRLAVHRCSFWKHRVDEQLSARLRACACVRLLCFVCLLRARASGACAFFLCTTVPNAVAQSARYHATWERAGAPQCQPQMHRARVTVQPGNARTHKSANHSWIERAFPCSLGTRSHQNHHVVAAWEHAAATVAQRAARQLLEECGNHPRCGSRKGLASMRVEASSILSNARA